MDRPDIQVAIKQFSALGLQADDSDGGPPRYDFKDQKTHRLNKSNNLAKWTLWKDSGVIFAKNQAMLPLSNEEGRQFSKLKSFQP